MKAAWLGLFCAVLAACAPMAPVVPPGTPLLRDELFGAPIEAAARDVFTLSEPMRRYLQDAVAAKLRRSGPYRGLFEALYTEGQLKLRYEASRTRDAADTFTERSGNCLSLVIMTAAFARELGIAVKFNRVFVEDNWARRGEMVFASGHVNLTLGRGVSEGGRFGNSVAAPLTIDFLPPDQVRLLRWQEIDESTVRAMYLNNRAAEELADGRIESAYWWARESVLRVPAYLPAYNTLAAVYRQRGLLAEAEQVLNQVLALEPAHEFALANLAGLLGQQGRAAEAELIRLRLARVENQAPFEYLELGRAALARRDYLRARDLFWREINRTGDTHESHFGLAQAELGLGHLKQARKHLAHAQAYSVTDGQRGLYAAKLARLEAARAQ